MIWRTYIYVLITSAIWLYYTTIALITSYHIYESIICEKPYNIEYALEHGAILCILSLRGAYHIYNVDHYA